MCKVNNKGQFLGILLKSFLQIYFSLLSTNNQLLKAIPFEIMFMLKNRNLITNLLMLGKVANPQLL